MTDREARITDLWTALNRQDFEAALRLLHPDVEWHCILDGVRLHGPAAVRTYWSQLYGRFIPGSSPITFRLIGEDRIAARMLHSVQDKRGKLWTEETVMQVFTFRDGLIIRMDLA